MVDIKKIQIVTYCDSDWDSVKTQISDNWISLPICGNADAVNQEMADAIRAVQNGEIWKHYDFLYFQKTTIFAYCYVKGIDECESKDDINEIVAAQQKFFLDYFGVPFGLKNVLSCSKKIQGKV